jgi:ABC-type transport system involved in multi-copper enzyme maturation permease subunit
MGKLIKAELYRTKKVNGFWVFAFFIILYMAAVPFVTSEKADSAETFFAGSLSNIAVGSLLIALMASYIVGRGYHHRTCMYEVMAGNSPMRIILSKLFSIALPIALIVYVAHLIGLGIACTMSTQGIGDVLAREPLFFLVLLRYTSFGVLLTMCVKSLLGTGLTYIRLLLESIGMIVASAITGTDLMEDSFGADVVVSNTTNTILNTAFLSQQGVLLARPMSSSVVWGP